MIRVLINHRDYYIRDTLDCFYASICDGTPNYVCELSLNPVLAGAQIRKCKQLVVHGGDTPTLIRRLSLIPGLFQALDNKTLALYSAGVGAFTVASFNVDHGRIIGGLGLIKMTSIGHYNNSLEFARNKLIKIFPHLHCLLVGNMPIELGVHTNGALLKG